jgi:hypothetical protein
MNLLIEIRKKQILAQIRKERPTQVINKVLKFEKNKYGFYNVKVDMEGQFYDIKIRHTVTMLPYPISKYNKLTTEQQQDWFFKYI